MLALGITSPAQVTKLDRGPLPPRSRCSLPANRATVALRNNGPLRNEGASHSERGALTATSSCRHSPFLPRFYPVFTPFCSVFTPVLPHFYPIFTLFLPRSAPSFLPPFYPVFTPLVKGKMPNLPRFYPVFTPPPVFTLSTVLPRVYPVPSTLRTPIPPFLPQG